MKLVGGDGQPMVFSAGPGFGSACHSLHGGECMCQGMHMPGHAYMVFAFLALYSALKGRGSMQLPLCLAFTPFCDIPVHLGI